MHDQPRPVWLTREQVGEDREWFKNWRDGMFSSTSRDKDGWPMEMHGLVARLEEYLDAWDAAPEDAAEAVRGAEAEWGRAGLGDFAVKARVAAVLHALRMPGA